MKLLLSILILSSFALGQQLSLAVRDLGGTGAPSMNCTVGQRYFRTDGTAGQNQYGCTATNTWTVLGGGSGNATTTGAFGSNPGTCTDGDVRFPTDSFYLLRCASNVWVRWGPIFPMGTVPTCATFDTWVNQSTAACTDSGGGLFFQQPNTGGSTQVRGKVQATPATPYSIVATGLTSLSGGINQRMAPIMLYESGTTKVVTFGFMQNANILQVDCWTSPTAYSSTPLGGGAGKAIPGGNIKLKVTADGTNIVYFISADGGINYDQVWTHAKTACFTTAPDRMGFGGDTEGGATTATSSMTLTHWAVN